MVNFRAQLDEVIKTKHLLSHCFYVRWQEGQLTLPELQGYAKEYYAFENEFPKFLSALHSNCDDTSMRQTILQNLIDEEKGEDRHPELWLRFSDGLQVPREDVKNYTVSDETRRLIQTFRKHATSGNLIDGISALYAYERQQPEVVREKAAGLKKFYGIDQDRAVQFFEVHKTVDIFHSEAEYNMLEKLCTDDIAKERALSVAKETVDALYAFLNGVDRLYHKAA